MKHSARFLIAAATLAAASSAYAATNNWLGTTDASWATTTNWSSGASPISTDMVTYTGTTNLTQTLDGSYTIAGIAFGAANTTTQSYVINNGTGGTANLLTLGTGGINTTGFDSSDSLVINTNILLGGNQTWKVANAGTAADLTVNGVISGSSALTIGWTSSTGVSTGQVGTTVLNGLNTYTGVTTINGSNTVGVDGSSFVQVTTIGNGGVAGNLGAASNAAGNLVFGQSGFSAGQLNYVGSGESTDRLFTINGHATIVNNGSGALNFTNAGTIAHGSGSHTLTLAGTNGGTFSSIIANGSGTISLTKAGTGTWTLAGANTYTGATTVSAGTLNITGSLTSAITVNSGGAISGNGDGVTTGKTTGLLTMNTGSFISLTGGSTTTSLTANGVTFAGVTNVIFGTPLVNGTTYDVVTSSGAVIDTANLANTYRGGFTGNGTTKITMTANVGTRTWNTTSGTWGINTGTTFTEGDQKFFSGDAVVFNDPGASSTITLAGRLAPNSVTVNNATNNYIFTGVAGTNDITGGTSLTKSGAAMLVLASANTYSGGTTINGGILSLSSNATTAGGSGSALGTGTVTVNTNGTLKLWVTTTGSTSYANNLVVNGGTVLGEDGVNTLTGAVSVGASGATFTSQWSNKDLVFTNTISGGDVTVSDVGVSQASKVIFAGANSYGTTTIGSNVTLQIGNGGTSGTLGTGAVTNAGTLAFNRTDTLTVSNAIGGAGSLTQAGTGTLVLTGTNTYTGNTVINGGALELGTGGSLGSGNYAGVISGAGALTKSGTGTQTFSGASANTYTGLTTVSAGTLSLAKNDGVIAIAGNVLVNGTGILQTSNGASGRIADASNITVDGSSAQFQLGWNQNDTINTLALNNGGTAAISMDGVSNLRPNGGITSTGGGSITGTASQLALNFNGATRTVTVADNTLTVGVSITNGGLTKQGNGTLTLNGSASNYTGGTLINAGTLNTGHANALGTGAVTVQGGTLAINAASVGQVTLGTGATLAMTSGSLAIDITGASTFDKVVGNATAHFSLTGGELVLNGFAGFEGSGVVGSSYNLLGSFAGTGNSTTGLTISGYDNTNWLASLDATTGTLSFTAVPEPSTYGLIGAGALAAVAAVRRRRKNAGKAA